MEPHVARLPAYAEYPSWLDYARALQAPGDQPPSERLLPLVRNERGEVSTLPLFIVIGAQKCGTTFLRSALSQHPMLNAARGYRGRCGGEVHFFDYRAGPAASLAADPKDGTAIATELLTAYSTKHFQQPVSSCVPSRYLPGVSQPCTFYSSFDSPQGCDSGPTSSDVEYFFDTTPRYMVLNDGIIDLMHSTLPQVRLVAVVREPVERFRSELAMEACAKRATIDLSFFHKHGFHIPSRMNDFINQSLREGTTEGHSGTLALFRGLYVSHLQRFLRVYPREQLHVIRAERLFRDPTHELNTLLHFLSLPPLTVNLSLDGVFTRPAKCNVSALLSDAEENRLRQFYQDRNRDPQLPEALYGYDYTTGDPSAMAQTRRARRARRSRR